MTAVFSHGRLRLYLLKLLAEGPKHGYELIRLLENRFLGLYAPSAGTIYPRLARLENEGQVTHTAVGGRKVYDITHAGRAELAARRAELAELESEIQSSVADLSTLANNIQREVSGSVRDIKRELREATRQARTPPAQSWPSGGRPSDWANRDWGNRDWANRDRADRDWARDQAQRSDDPEWDRGPHAGRGEGRGAGRGRGRARGRRNNGEPDDDHASDADLADLATALTDLAGEVHRAARQAGVGANEIRSATAVVIGAINELRRLLRR
jgi:DNA-binding PadR family transcriptional regulator